MKVNALNNINNIKNTDKNNQSNPNFKGLLDIPGYAMNGIEKGGFAASFIIQDTAGMTAPRTGEGLIRGIDKERLTATKNVIKARLMFREPSEEDKQKCLKLKDLNFKEGAEVAIREGLSGPMIMFTPMLVLLLGKKFVGKSTFSNSSLINRLGKKLSNTVADSPATLKASEIKNEFYRNTVKDMVKSTTTPEIDEAASSFIEKTVKKLEMLDKFDEKISKSSGRMKSVYKKAKAKNHEQLLKDFNDYHKSNSSDLDMMNRVKFDGSVFSTEKAVDGLRAYAHDALSGKKAEELFKSGVDRIDERLAYSDKVKKGALIKRGAVNAIAAASTIGSLSIVPALYKLVNPVPPGALGDPTAEQKNTQVKQPEQKKTNKDGQVSFTGKLDVLAKNFEFSGNQLTPALMTGLSVVGIVGPRITTAVKRAPEDPVTKKKDYSEVPEALTRDAVSIGAVTFGVPMLSKALISTYEKASGFVLKNRPKTEMSTTKKVLDYLNPFSGITYYGIKDLDQIYGNVDTPKKLNSLSTFIDNNGGSIAKVLKTEKGTKGVFERYGLDIKELASHSDRRAANSTIIEKMNNCKEFAQDLVKAITPEAGKSSAMLNRARSLNSYVSFASTIFFVPVFLGLVLPKMVYAMTARTQKKAAEARAAYANQQQTAQATQSNTIDYSKLKSQTNTTFTQLKHS